MNYNLADPKEVIAARSRITYLVRKKARVSITEKHVGRTLNQNSYLHLLLGAFGLHFGYTLEEAKYIYKQINKDYYFYKKKDRTFVHSSADLNKDEMAATIDRFMRASAEQGYELPKAENADFLSLVENEMEKNRRYL